jgi:hypothetical protein
MIYLLRLVALLGFVFMIVTCAWLIVTMLRMKREQIVALATLNSIAATLKLQRATDKLQGDQNGIVPSITRDKHS